LENQLMAGIQIKGEFAKEFFKAQKSIGSLFPSSVELAKSMFTARKPSDDGIRILEVGSGSGVISEQIHRNMNANDCLHIVELNKRFCHITSQRLSGLASAGANHKQFEVINDDILNCRFESKKFDVIVCSLPFNNFDGKLVEDIFSHLSGLVNEDGELRFFEYILLRRIRIWSSLGMAKNLSHIESVLTNYIARYNGTHKAIYKNLPPAMIYNLKF
jgi:phospholipid N-methyltransferase